MERKDLISSLPDEILGKILTLLPTKVAASTSILSKRWRNLLLLVDTLWFDGSVVVYSNQEEAASGSHRFFDFVDRTSALLSDSRIKKFSFCHVFGYDPEDEEYSRCICTAMEQHALLELQLYAAGWLETKLFTSNTLVKLTISGHVCLRVERVFFPALRSLSLLSAALIDGENYCGLIQGCPLLEELFISDDDDWLVQPGCAMFGVYSPSIKRLVVFTNFPKDKDDHDHIYFDTPSLVYLDYTSYVFKQYLLDDLDLLVEARLNLKLWESTNDCDYSDDDDDDDDDDNDDDDDDDNDDDDDDDDDDDLLPHVDEPKAAIFGDVTDLVMGISNITTLHLSPDSLEAFHFCCKSMPVFNNLLNLSIESTKEKGWQVMPLLLKSCPILQSLVIKGLLHRVTNRCGDACACIPKKPRQKKEEEEICCLWTCQVKVLKISEYGGSFQELRQMRHFLGKLECVETVKVDLNNNKSKLLQANLLTLPRLSSKCNIQFI